MTDLLHDRVVAAIGDLYDIEAELGRGGMAVVYRARDVRLRRRVAVKVLPPDLAFRDDVRRRFLREAETAAQLSHPNIVPIYSVDERDGVVYIVMALVEGESLAARLAREPRPSFREVERLLAEVADALAYAHARGVVHRDIKPDNILLDAESGRAMVTDFGIARAAEAGSRLTVTGIAVGTPAYMSPEQALGEREVDGRSDLYSLGVVGYQMLAGEPPFVATNTPAMLMKHLSEVPRPLAERRSDAPAWLCAAIERAMAKDVNDRWPNAGAFRAVLTGEAADTLTPTPRASPAPSADGREAGRLPWLNTAPISPRPPAPARVPTLTPRYETRRDARQDARHEAHHEARTARRDARRDELARFAERPLEERIALFRRKLFGSAGTLVFLGFINLAFSPFFPWVVFPAFGMASQLFRRWESIGSEKVRFWDVVLGRDADARRLAHADDDGRTPLAARVASFRRWTQATAALGGTAVAGIAVFNTVGGGAIQQVAILSAAGAVGAGAVAAGKGIALKRLGLRVRDMLGGTWRQVLGAGNPRLAAQLDAEDAAVLAAPDVLAGAFGGPVRRAVEDRATIRAALHKLAPADRALIPDVAPTVDALVERVASIAGALHRLEQDVSEDALARIETRIAEAERDTVGEESRTLALLRRQGSTLRELLARRATLLTQLESAGLALQNIRLDLVKLRSGGLASFTDVTNATQEARALSRDIGHVLDAAAEVRRI